MNQEVMTGEQTTKPEAADRSNSAERLDAVGWGLFFIWIGAALLFEFSWGTTLVGIGIITLAGQLARFSSRLKLEGFWIVVGVAFLLGGIWQLVDAEMSLGPILLILAGLTVLLGGFLPKRLKSHID
jgi:hypothetical protein